MIRIATKCLKFIHKKGETSVLLVEQAVEDEEFSPAVMGESSTWVIPPTEVALRRDLRSLPPFLSPLTSL